MPDPDNFNQNFGSIYNIYLCNGIVECPDTGWDEAECTFDRAAEYGPWQQTETSCQYVRQRFCVSNDGEQTLSSELAAELCTEPTDPRIDNLDTAEMKVAYIRYVKMPKSRFGPKFPPSA